MFEMFKDKEVQKSMLISFSGVMFMVFEIIGLIGNFPWEWLNILANVLLLIFVIVFLTFIGGIIIYGEFYGEG